MAGSGRHQHDSAAGRELPSDYFVLDNYEQISYESST